MNTWLFSHDTNVVGTRNPGKFQYIKSLGKTLEADGCSMGRNIEIGDQLSPHIKYLCFAVLTEIITK